MAREPASVRGVRSYATPYTKRVPLVDALRLTKDWIEVRTLIGEPRRYHRAEIRCVARVSYRILPLVRRHCLKVTFTTKGVMALYFLPWSMRRLERALRNAGWNVADGPRM